MQNVFSVSEDWRATYPGADAGILVMRDVTNPGQHEGLDRRKAELESALRSQFSSRAEIAALPVLQAYDAYYKRFKKTYHVQGQLESVALKGKPIPHVAALVEAMFMAELANLMLTAGHDLTSIEMPITLDVGKGTESYTMLNGKEQVLKPGDMMMADARGIISSILYGPDLRTRITPETRQVLFAVYAPPGIGETAVYRHLQTIQSNVSLVAPAAQVELMQVYPA